MRNSRRSSPRCVTGYSDCVAIEPRSPEPPVHCRREAWQQLRRQLDDLESNGGLLGAAVAIAMHTDPGVDAAGVRARIEELSRQIAARCTGRSPRAVVAHAHALLFDELGFEGDLEDYGNPSNSLIHEVLHRRRGLPITLALVYKLVLEGAGDVTVHGVNAPGHFLVRVESRQEGFTPMLVDPFHRGRTLSTPEALALVRGLVGEIVDRRADPLPLATHRDWVLRMLRNLVGVYHERQRPADRAAMEELARLLWAGGA